MRRHRDAFGNSFIVVGVMATAIFLWSLPTYGDDQLGQTQQEIRGGEPIPGATGIVDFAIPGGNCTGSIISPNTVITAAHCLDKAGAKTTSSGNTNIVISYYDPTIGRRMVFNGNATWRVLPEYKGTTGNAGGSNSDFGLIVIPSIFVDTDYHDYLRIYDGAGGALDTWLTAYGAGRYTYSGKTDDNIRRAEFEVEHVTVNHIVVDTRKYVGLCKGDSGGPLMFAVNSGENQVPTIAAVLSGHELLGDEGDWCTNNDWGVDDAFYFRTTWEKLDSIMAAAGMSCQRISSGEQSYRRCFDLPFIEDIEWEGMDRDLAVAIAASSIF